MLQTEENLTRYQRFVFQWEMLSEFLTSYWRGKRLRWRMENDKHASNLTHKNDCSFEWRHRTATVIGIVVVYRMEFGKTKLVLSKEKWPSTMYKLLLGQWVFVYVKVKISFSPNTRVTIKASGFIMTSIHYRFSWKCNNFNIINIFLHSNWAIMGKWPANRE